MEGRVSDSGDMIYLACCMVPYSQSLETMKSIALWFWFQASPSDPENYPFVVLGNKIDVDGGNSRVVSWLSFHLASFVIILSQHRLIFVFYFGLGFWEESKGMVCLKGKHTLLWDFCKRRIQCGSCFPVYSQECSQEWTWRRNVSIWVATFFCIYFFLNWNTIKGLGRNQNFFAIPLLPSYRC